MATFLKKVSLKIALLIALPLSGLLANETADLHPDLQRIIDSDLRSQAIWLGELQTFEDVYAEVPIETRIHKLLLQLERSIIFDRFLDFMFPPVDEAQVDPYRTYMDRREFNELLMGSSAQHLKSRLPKFKKVLREYQEARIGELEQAYSSLGPNQNLLRRLQSEHRVFDFMILSGLGLSILSEPGSLPYFLGLLNGSMGFLNGYGISSSSSTRVERQKPNVHYLLDKMKDLLHEHIFLHVLEREIYLLLTSKRLAEVHASQNEPHSAYTCSDALLAGP